MNTFMNNLNEENNMTRTENGALARKSTNDKVYDLFALGGAYRNRSKEDQTLLFKNAFEENPDLALKCLFYLRDCRGGQGSRDFFRNCYHWLANQYPVSALHNLEAIPTFGRVDDLYCLVDTIIEADMFGYIKETIDYIRSGNEKDIEKYTFFKWLKSENASSAETKKLARKTREALGMTAKDYRKMLSKGRNECKVLERLMSDRRWDEIEFDKIPSQAGIKYRKAFEGQEPVKDRYKEFAKDNATKVNADVLNPCEIVSRVTKAESYYKECSETERQMLEKYWNNLPDYFNGNKSNILCVVDTSGSMTWANGVRPIDVAISLGMYCGERSGGDFHNCYISFSNQPQVIKIEGVDFVDKVRRIYKTNLCANTDLVRTFEMLRQMALKSKPEDIPETIVVISDMQIDEGSTFFDDMSYYERKKCIGNTKVRTEMEFERQRWEESGLKMPKLVYWNVESRGNAAFLDNGPDVTYVSGYSPVIFEQVLTGKTGKDMMMDKLNSDRYKNIRACSLKDLK